MDRQLICEGFPCEDVRHDCYVVPPVPVRPKDISIMLISEAAPADPGDYYYAKGRPLFLQTTLQAFNDAAAEVSSLQDILALGVYLTTAVKCGKTGYGIKGSTIRECSSVLRKEMALFPYVRALLLMGDVAINAVNCIAHEAGEQRVIPAGSTYKIRGQKYFFQGKRVFPSYLQAGPSFFIEKSKRRMIAEDIAAALSLVKQHRPCGTMGATPAGRCATKENQIGSRAGGRGRMRYQPPSQTIDDYIAGFPPDVQQILQKVRTTIRKAAPEAEEAISYQMPTFKLEGNLVHFAAFKNHIGLYPTPSGTEKFREELSPYETGKGSIRFPLDKPIPYDLIARIVKFRVKENVERAQVRRKKK